MNLEICEYTQEDSEDLLRLTTEIVDLMAKTDPHKRFRPREDFDVEEFTTCELQKVKDTGGKLFLAKVDGKSVGYIMGTVCKEEKRDTLNKYPINRGYIDALFVDEEFRGKGISTKLLKEMENFFQSVGCDHVGITCIAANSPARSLYEKAGYTEQYIDFLKKV